MTPPPPEADVARLILAPETPGPADGGGLGHLPGVTQVDDLGEEQTTTVHYDTPDLRLTRDGASLVRRGDDDGEWILRLPGLSRSRPSPDQAATARPTGEAGDDTTGPDGEIIHRVRPGEAAPPPRLAELARALVRGAPLLPVARSSSSSSTTTSKPAARSASPNVAACSP